MPGIQRFEMCLILIGTMCLFSSHCFDDCLRQMYCLLFCTCGNPKWIGQSFDIFALNIFGMIDDRFEKVRTQVGIQPAQDKP